ncbi:MAG TPA: NAD(P)H-dependent oxidoreductase [Candidatus Bilamarchaeum sp.]|nr:NAD(P)H-dependent oxidoreductase [Candidatus Bilamarchaeum sp.]
MEFKQIVMGRYATKKFKGKIGQEKVDELIELIRYAPSSFNIQPWKILVISDQATKEKLAPLAWNQPQVTTCSHLIVFCADSDLRVLVQKLEKQMLDGGATREGIKAYVDMMHGFVDSMGEEHIKTAWAQKQVYLALANALNGAKALGFDSCPMEGFDPKAFKEALKLPDNLHPTVLCPIGYADDEPRPKSRFSAKDLLL